MRIDALELTNFRNFASATLHPGPGVNIFYGENGSGKTSLLEAIFTLCLGKSQRGARDEMMVHSGGNDIFRLEGKGEVEGREINLACAYQKGGRKKITVDDNPVRLSHLYQLLSIISMAPDDVTLFSGSPGGRRRFLDLHLSQASPSYLADLTDYERALAQKNAFLKNDSAGECPFDPLLVQGGGRIMSARIAFIGFLKDLAPVYYHQISTGCMEDEAFALSFDYDPNVPFDTKEEITAHFEMKLAAERRREAAMQTAVVGPHRDDIDFRIGPFPAKGYGSQGELRSAAAAVMMAAAAFLENRRKEKPILLLDEIFAELDEQRRDNMAGLFEHFQQIFLTTALEPPEVLVSRASVFRIKAGQVEPK